MAAASATALEHPRHEEQRQRRQTRRRAVVRAAPLLAPRTLLGTPARTCIHLCMVPQLQLSLGCMLTARKAHGLPGAGPFGEVCTATVPRLNVCGCLYIRNHNSIPKRYARDHQAPARITVGLKASPGPASGAAGSCAALPLNMRSRGATQACRTSITRCQSYNTGSPLTPTHMRCTAP